VGLVAKRAFSDELSFGGEASLYYRSLYSYKSGSVSIDEMALCIPLTVNYKLPSDRFPVYVSGGLELDVPFNTQRFEYSSGVDIDDRAAVDIGFLLGAGYMINQNIGVDARYVFNFNEPRKNSSNLLMSYGVGVFVIF